jgi:hypothetical protein
VSSKPGTDVRSGIHTEGDLEGDPPGFRVEWIDWDSDFRRELRLNDLITAVNGQPLTPFLQPGKLSKGVGQPAEGQYWSDIGAAAGAEIALTVLRDGQPVTVTGGLGTDWFHYDAAGRPALGPDGPARLSNDGFADAWASWYEQVQTRLSRILTRGLTMRSLNTRNELADLLEHEPRVAYLQSHWPGPFAQAVHDDWRRAVDLVRGRAAAPPVSLEFREIGARRIEVARAAASEAWSRLLEDTASLRTPAFPAGSPLERERWIGALIELPPLTGHHLRNDMGKTFLAAGSPADGYWYMLFDQPEVAAFWKVFYRYKGQVNPRLSDRYRFLVRVLDSAQMFTVDGRSIMGMGVVPVAALAGEDELFVDLRSEAPAFAGEAALSAFDDVPRDDMQPASVLTAMVHAVKMGDDVTWRSLFAPWRVMSGPSGRPMLDMGYATQSSMFAREWDRSRFLIMGEVHDVRVERVEPVRRVLDGDAGAGIPAVDQVVAWVDHYGFFDGEHRVFQNVNVNRRWVLERLDGGPWRIVSIQSL